MRYIIICSLSASPARPKALALLQNYGLAIAPGVYECELAPKDWDMLGKALGALPLGAEDSVIVYALCAACEKKRHVFGVQPADAGGHWLII